MTEEEDFIRVATNVFSGVKVVDFLNDKSVVQKVEEAEGRLNEFEKQTNNVIQILDDRIMFGLIDKDERDRLVNEIVRIKNEYLNN
ncbi:hypothetical protein D0817_24480 [Flavobacterium cupreum]|uniref:Uncharacterized protein n=1 Tax=Flavobacterium cupreum TaxID=2133766 RepID=A0A434A0B6_9FLAO|nr:hypothetical protein [Flavobacterium cupreum]RUT67813.1 hypothetical protein D0817_24480 [Flavobacterium cupreum]